jgi:hypothetical protein
MSPIYFLFFELNIEFKQLEILLSFLWIMFTYIWISTKIWIFEASPGMHSAHLGQSKFRIFFKHPL